MEALNQARSDDTDHPWVPLCRSKHEAASLGQVWPRREYCEYLGEHLLFNSLTYAVLLVQVSSQGARSVDICGGEQLDGFLRLGQPATGVEARAETEADIAARHLSLTAHLLQRPEPRARAPLDLLEPTGHQHPVLFHQRYQIRDRPQSDQIQIPPQVRALLLALLAQAHP